MSKTSKSILWIVVAIIVIALIWIGVSKNQTPQTTEGEIIKIGFIGPLSGDASVVGISEKNAVEMAVKEINALKNKGGIKLEVVYEDGRCDGKEAVSAINKLINIDNIKFILGGICSSETLSIAPMAEENKVIVLSAFSSSPEITNAGDYIFRICPADTDPNILSNLIPYIKDYKIALISENSDYSLGIRGGIKNEVNGENIVFDDLFNPGEKDFRSILTKIKTKNPEAIFINTATNSKTAGFIAKQIVELGMENINMFGNFMLLGQDAIDIAGEGLEGAMIFDVTKLDDEDDVISSFVEKYKELYGEPYNFWEVGARYDTVYLVKNALEECGEDIECIKDYFYNMDWYDGISGRFKFDENGDVLGIKGSVKQMINGEVVVIE